MLLVVKYFKITFCLSEYFNCFHFFSYWWKFLQPIMWCILSHISFICTKNTKYGTNSIVFNAVFSMNLDLSAATSSKKGSTVILAPFFDIQNTFYNIQYSKCLLRWLSTTGHPERAERGGTPRRLAVGQFNELLGVLHYVHTKLQIHKIQNPNKFQFLNSSNI